jgi:hypothetical protein
LKYLNYVTNFIIYNCLANNSSVIHIFFLNVEIITNFVIDDHDVFQNVKHLNKHGDIRGESIDDILKANDCLSKNCREADSKLAAAMTPMKQDKLDETIYIDLESNCTIIHETIQVKSQKDSPHKVDESSFETRSEEISSDDRSSIIDKALVRPDWKTHKRERSDDSLPDPDNPMYNLLLLSKSAVREQKRLAVEIDDNGSYGSKDEAETSESKTPKAEAKMGHYGAGFSPIKKLMCDEKMLEWKTSGANQQYEAYKARFFLSVFHALTGLAALASCHLRKNGVI